MITPTVWMNRTADEAADYYADVFTSAGLPAQVTGRLNYPDPMDFYLPEFAGRTRVRFFTLDNLTIGLINAADEHTPNPSISIMVNFDPSQLPDAPSQLTQVWEWLSAHGQVLMPLDAYPFSEKFGWVQDRYGLNWQLILTNPEGEPRPLAMPYLLFSGPQQDKAQEALDYYLSIFPDSHLGNRIYYEDNRERVMFSDALVAGVWMVFNDSGIDQPFTFSPGVSFYLTAADAQQAEYLHGKLSADPAKDNFGWCEDPYGVTWQIGYEGQDV